MAKDIIPRDKTYFGIWQETWGKQALMVRYELFPRNCNTACWSMVNRESANVTEDAVNARTNINYIYSESDIWHCNLKPKEFAERLKNYDYLFIANPDEIFWDKYNSLFKNKEKDIGGIIFEIDKTHGKITLNKII